jgi:hypothetical protein
MILDATISAVSARTVALVHDREQLGDVLQPQAASLAVLDESHALNGGLVVEALVGVCATR